MKTPEKPKQFTTGSTTCDLKCSQIYQHVNW